MPIFESFSILEKLWNPSICSRRGAAPLTSDYKGDSSTGAMGAWAPADIQQQVPGTHPEMSLGYQSLHLSSKIPRF